MATENPNRPRRLFFALWPDETVARSLDRAAQGAHGGCGGRRTARDSLHLTLAFLGDVPADRLDAVQAAAGAVTGDAFLLRLERLGYWKHNRILWAGTDNLPPALAALAEALGAQLRAAGFKLELRPFAAHVTLLRNARCTAAPELAAPIDWAAEDFVLVESAPRGPVRYRVLARWPLRF